MFRLMRKTFIVCLLFLVIGVGHSSAVNSVLTRRMFNPIAKVANPQSPMDCREGVQSSGALYQICMPFSFLWNGDLVIYAHGYVQDNKPLAIPEEGNDIATIVNLLGYAFASTSYSTNGLAVRPGLADVVDLVDVFTALHGVPEKVIIVGASEGGLITTLAVERHADVFSGGLALCGPIGNFREQTDHFGHFRVIYDHFFPGLLPSSPIAIPQNLIDTWDTHFTTVIKPALDDPANASALAQLLNVTGTDYPPGDAVTREESVRGILGYNVIATNDGKLKLGGQPFDNQSKVYAGSNDDTLLNQNVQRFTANQTAIAEMETYYQTTGNLSIPLVTSHTTGDPIVPYWHADLYQDKVAQAGRTALYQHIRINRYGHCTFTVTELEAAFAVLVIMIENQPDPIYQVYIPWVQR